MWCVCLWVGGKSEGERERERERDMNTSGREKLQRKTTHSFCAWYRGTMAANTSFCFCVCSCKSECNIQRTELRSDLPPLTLSLSLSRVRFSPLSSSHSYSSCLSSPLLALSPGCAAQSVRPIATPNAPFEKPENLKQALRGARERERENEEPFLSGKDRGRSRRSTEATKKGEQKGKEREKRRDRERERERRREHTHTHTHTFREREREREREAEREREREGRKEER